jgi:sugar phosphate permease
LLSVGLLGSALACALFGSLGSALALGLAYCANGLFQATGWPGTTRVMADFTTPKNRGSVMALWSPCYQVGGIAANLFCGYLLVHAGWRSAFRVPALVLASMALLVWFALPERPSQAALAPASHAEGEQERRLVALAQRRLLRDPLLWSYGASYFFIKFIRYALLFWLPYYLSTTLAYRADVAASVSSAFELGGIFGVIAIGVLSDRTRRLSRAALSLCSLLGLSLSLFLYMGLSKLGVLANVFGLACIGALLFGPDALLSGAAAQDAGGVRAAAMAAGMVNGVGSLGAILEGFAVPRISRHFGWQALFPVLVVLALAAALSLSPALLRAKIPREE